MKIRIWKNIFRHAGIMMLYADSSPSLKKQFTKKAGRINNTMNGFIHRFTPPNLSSYKKKLKIYFNIIPHLNSSHEFYRGVNSKVGEFKGLTADQFFGILV